ncbi:MAG: Nramp family divalent metal transporter [Dysgonamonadaceae bacterium]|jgi:manganese transport protein|nr:Nramp family divalent metal transporter [Dysgonamonadaceae bacterium]
MKLNNSIKKLFDKKGDKPSLDFFKYMGPGLLVTVGFIDPGNWASNIAAGSEFGYSLLWMVTLSTVMLIILQHNVAHLGIVTGKCLSEAVTEKLPEKLGRGILGTAMFASVSTSLAEILGSAIALQMLFDVPVKLGAVLSTILILIMIYGNSYRKIERWIIGFVSIIGFSFLYELTIAPIEWGIATKAWLTPSMPDGSILIIMSVLGAVVMPHNLFLHSEIIQSRQWNLKDDAVIKKQLKFEFADTIFSMIIGWAINSAMILLAASTFFANPAPVGELQQAQSMLTPLLGKGAGIVFAMALLFAGISSSITSGMAGGTIFAGIYGEPYDIKDKHSQWGVGISLIVALVIIMFISNPFQGLIYSQMILSIQLPITIFTQIYLTSNKELMGKYANKTHLNVLLLTIGSIVTYLNVRLLLSFL